MAVSCSCSCTVLVDLQPLGGTGCGLQNVKGGYPRSIGSQYITYTLTDPCSVVQSVAINGNSGQVFVNDGDNVVVTLNLVSMASVCYSNISCVSSSPHSFAPMAFLSPGRSSIVLNKKAIIANLLRNRRSRQGTQS